MPPPEKTATHTAHAVKPGRTAREKTIDKAQGKKPASQAPPEPARPTGSERPSAADSGKKVQRPAATGSSLSKLSLKIHEEQKEASKAEGEKTDSPDKPVTSFSKEAFTNAWEKLAASYKKDRLSLYMAMTSHQPKLLKDHIILLPLDNTIQEDLINEEKPALLGKLHELLRNYALEIRTEIIKPRKTSKVYLPKDKLQKLIEKNPEIRQLQNDMGLDLIY